MMKNWKRKDLSEKLPKVEKVLWDKAKEHKIPFPEKGFEERLMHRIQQRKEKIARTLFLDLLGNLAWRFIPIAASILVLVGFLTYHRYFKDENIWADLVMEQDSQIKWIIEQGGDL